MNLFKKGTFLGILALAFFLSAFSSVTNWGFFAHRRINRLAVFTLPIDLIPFYKKHIDYLTENAVGPDKRRYAVATEGIRHYIDLDIWGTLPFEKLPRNIVDARRSYTEVIVLNNQNDTIRLFGQQMELDADGSLILKGKNFQQFFKRDSLFIDQEDYEDFFYEKIYNPLYEKEWAMDCRELIDYFDRYDFVLPCDKAIAVDTFVEHGVLPYNLVRLQRNLTKAMEAMDSGLILRLSADMGHYIGDAHVPLHTTSNYNGYQTDQIGIHAFWETRLPELFADEQFDYFVGQATYIENPSSYYWNIVLNSHSLVTDVLSIEKELSQTYPKDQQDCFVERGTGAMQNIPCVAYAEKYHLLLDGQVEQQMRAAIKAVGDAWYTAWINAGQPDLSRVYRKKANLEDQKEKEELERTFNLGKILGRKH